MEFPVSYPPATRLPRSVIGGAAVTASVVVALTGALTASAATTSTTVAPTSMTTSAGVTGSGQTAKNLAALDQSGGKDTWSKYVEFSPSGGKAYVGTRDYTVPAAARGGATKLSVKVNYRGPAKSTQSWTWSAYNWTTSSWSTLGDNAFAPSWGSWKAGTLSAASPSGLIRADGLVRIRLVAGNTADSADLDYEAVIVETGGTATANPTTSTPTGSSTSAPTASQTSTNSTPASSSSTTINKPPSASATLPKPSSTTTAAPVGGGSSSGGGASSGSVTLPPAGAKFDYQLGGAYTPPSGVTVLERDRSEKPVAGLYNICYLNGFQTQPEETSWWQSNHPELLAKTSSGALIKDGDWNEVVFDVSTAAKRSALLEVQKSWVDGCAAAGYDAVEADNQDSYSRSKGLFTFTANKEYMKIFTAYAHTKGLAVAQKNTAEEYGTTGKTEVGFDFAIAEECSVWSECDGYITAFGKNVIEIEYTDQSASAFTKACASWSSHHSIIRRDRNLVAAGQSGYAYQTCS